ncbi:histidine kinase, partial [Mesorhizobium sp. M2D.F.Ca.ET.233.01.1.1]
MSASGKTPPPRRAVTHEQSNGFATRPVFAAVAAFVVTLALALAARRWFDPVLLICVA